MKEIIKTDLAPAAVGTYSQGVKFNGVYYFSGQIGINPETSVMSESFDEQLAQIMKNIDGLLKSQDLREKTSLRRRSFFKILETLIK